MTRKQIAFIISVNAVISAAISVAVTLLIAQPAEILPTSTPARAAVAESTPAVVVEVTPGVEPVIHTVQSGDTISGLALLYDVPEADIIAANQLVNPDFLQLGMQLVIPVGGLAQATATFTPAPTPTDTPIPFEPPSADMTATAGAVLGVTATALPKPPATGDLKVEIGEILGIGQVDQETVVINNLGDRLADMEGWTLSDTDGNIYTFPNFRLWVGGSVMVHTRIGQDGNPPADLFWGKLEAVWSPGDVATLKDAAGATISTLVAGQ